MLISSTIPIWLVVVFKVLAWACVGVLGILGLAFIIFFWNFRPF